ncbi:PfkB family carbohydrate kinase [Leucobacter sp. wl10]|uniref:PfkB family carbohydrate kinase n=1 Tax=Leucobacter sp. wl10 TaxID=2304677 RepID=UPI000E5AE044|nr:PfkB family carbohydrate kinase [Leucobacter sp. wl10]RGE17615.1 sugar kinase [Leucobacter sp. wl10]
MSTRAPRVLHTGQAIADIVLRIPALPSAGGDVLASATDITAGGGFNVMAAAARDGAPVTYLGAIGEGPFANIVTSALKTEGIEVPNPPVTGTDTGFSVAMVDDSTERTFVTSPGAETYVQLEHLTGTAVSAHDIVYVTGYSLLHEHNRASLLKWIPTLPAATTIIFDPSPLVHEIADEAWTLLQQRATIWTLNVREAALAATRFNAPAEDPRTLLDTLAGHLHGRVILRDGNAGAYLSEHTPPLIPGMRVRAVDTNGAGDAHTGVLAAALTRGDNLHDAVRRANIAAAFAVTRTGPATAPHRADIDRALHA